MKQHSFDPLRMGSAASPSGVENLKRPKLPASRTILMVNSDVFTSPTPTTPPASYPPSSTTLTSLLTAPRDQQTQIITLRSPLTMITHTRSP